MLVLDSGGITRLARRRQDSVALIAVLKRDGLWPPLVPSVVLAESITGGQRHDVNINRFLKACEITEAPTERLARRAGALRARARRGSAVDAIVVATAEPGGSVLTGDVEDLRALAVHADGVRIHRA